MLRICSTLLLLLWLVCVLFPSQAWTKKTSALSVSIIGLKHNKGAVGCLLFRSAKGFPGKAKAAIQAARSTITKKRARCLFKNVPTGTYAVTIMHDENNNQKLDTGLFGIPKEGYGFSNNAKPGMFGPPPFAKAAFAFRPPKHTITIKVRY